MKIIRAKDYEEMSYKVAKLVRKQIKNKPDSVIAFPTGATPKGMYELLVAAFVAGKDDWSMVNAYNLDEYVGLSTQNPLSYYQYMHSNFYNLVNIKPENIHIPNGNGNLDKNILEFKKIFSKTGNPDLAILGIGENGHIGFQEPGSKRESEFGIVDLSESTIKANSRFFPNIKNVPKKAIAMGLSEILSSQKIILIANGRNKAKAIRAMIKDPVSSDCPASFLREHKNVIIIVDDAAAVYIDE